MKNFTLIITSALLCTTAVAMDNYTPKFSTGYTPLAHDITEVVIAPERIIQARARHQAHMATIEEKITELQTYLQTVNTRMQEDLARYTALVAACQLEHALNQPKNIVPTKDSALQPE